MFVNGVPKTPSPHIQPNTARCPIRVRRLGLAGASWGWDSGKVRKGVGIRKCVCNDPSAGSPTETLLRLLLPLNDKV